MADASVERHTRHEACMEAHEKRLDDLEDGEQRASIWRTGNGNPHRGAEARITRIEEGAIMRDHIQEIIDRAVSARQRSALAIINALAPYVGMAAMFLWWIATKTPPPRVTP